MVDDHRVEFALGPARYNRYEEEALVGVRGSGLITAKKWEGEAEGMNSSGDSEPE